MPIPFIMPIPLCKGRCGILLLVWMILQSTYVNVKIRSFSFCSSRRSFGRGDHLTMVGFEAKYSSIVLYACLRNIITAPLLIKYILSIWCTFDVLGRTVSEKTVSCQLQFIDLSRVLNNNRFIQAAHTLDTIDTIDTIFRCMDLMRALNWYGIYSDNSAD